MSRRRRAKNRVNTPTRRSLYAPRDRARVDSSPRKRGPFRPYSFGSLQDPYRYSYAVPLRRRLARAHDANVNLKKNSSASRSMVPTFGRPIPVGAPQRARRSTKSPCTQRHERKQVLFAKRKTGRGQPQRKQPVFTKNSKLRCS